MRWGRLRTLEDSPSEFPLEELCSRKCASHHYVESREVHPTLLVWQVEGGEGQFGGASGLITSILPSARLAMLSTVTSG